MFSFFRKKSASKESKPETQLPDVKEDRREDEEDRKIAESNKKRIKSDKKNSKDKKGLFKSETEPAIVSGDNSSTSSIASKKTVENTPPIALTTEEKSIPTPPLIDSVDHGEVKEVPSSIVSHKASENTPIIALIAEEKKNTITPPLMGPVDHCEVGEVPSQSDCCFLLQEEPPDEFCEAQEVLLPELSSPLPLTLTQPSQLVPMGVLVPEMTSSLGNDLSELNSKDKQPHGRRVSFNCKDIVIYDPDDVSVKDSAIPDAMHKLSVKITLRDLDEAPLSTAPFLPEEASPLHEISNVQHDETMSTLQDEQTELLTDMEEQLRRMESELREKTERVEQLEAMLADEDRQIQLEAIERLEAEWNKERELIDNEREEELRLLQEALEEALEEKAEIESKMLRDASRESQLLDDFEWKLGEIEREYKKKLVETEKSAEERFKNEMAMEYQKLVEDKRGIDEKLTEIAHLKSYEAEVTQLRGLVFEQQRVIRTAARQVDHLKETEKILEDDLHKIRMQGCTRKQQQEMEAKWKENSLTECNRLRAELVASNEEEMLKAIRQVVREKDDQIAAIKKQLDAQQIAMNHQIAELNNSFQQREAKLNKQVEATRAEADRELCDLRRQLNKVQDSHIEFMEQVEQKHAEQLEQCGSSNEENKEALEQTYEDKLQSIEFQHQSQLIYSIDALQSLIEEEKQEALTQLGEHYQTQLQSLQEHISDLQRRLIEGNKMSSQRQLELDRLQELVLQQEEQLELLQQRSEDQTESNRETSSSRRRSSDESTASTTESSSEEDYDESTPPNGRGAGDGCSPSTSAAACQDNLRPCPELDASILSSIHPAVATHQIDSSEECLSIKIEHFDQMQSTMMCCDDPEHAEAQQMILEMHQVLADRDAELQRLTEEKRFYQLELIHWERNLALQRVGLPLALVPDRLSNESELNPWRGFSAPPVTKPRLPDNLRYPSATAFGGSRAASYELFSPSATSLSPDNQCGRQLFPAQHSSTLLTTEEWMSEGALVPPDVRQMHWPPQQGSHFYYSDDEDDDSNNNGFTTPL